MKKAIFGIVALASVAMTSCDTDVKDSIGTYGYPQLNLVTDLQSGTTSIRKSTYSVYVNHTQGIASISTPEPFSINDVKYNFATDTVAIKDTFLDTPIGKSPVTQINGAKGNVNNDPSLPLNNFKCDVANFQVPYQLIAIKDVPNVSTNLQSLMLDYSIGDRFAVKSIFNDVFYTGKTLTTYPGEGGALQSYTNEELFYRVILDTEKNKAKVVMYSAKFAQEMPKTLNIVLYNLDVNLSRGSYTITGKDIVPKVAEGNGLTENENFIFNSFTLTFEDSHLTTAVITYKVKGIFSGNFRGSCLVQYKVSQ